MRGHWLAEPGESMNDLLTTLLKPLIDSLPMLAPYVWVLKGLVILLVTGFISLLVNRLLRSIVNRLTGATQSWKGVAIKALYRPVRVLVWVFGITFALEIAAQALDNIDLNVAQDFRSIALILLILWGMLRLITRVEAKLTSETDFERSVDRTTADAISKLLRLVVLVLGSLVLLQNLGVSVSGILAFGGVGGLAVGFAAKDLLANFFGGLMIYMDRPFKVGDWIRSPDKNIEGTVEAIGWRLTRIRTFDKRPLYVPNSTFASISVENPSRMTNRRIYETIGVRYDDVDQVKAIVSDIREMLSTHPEIDTRQTLIVNLNHFGPSSLDILVYSFTKTTDWVRFHEIKEEVLMRIMHLILERGAEVAYPTSTMHLASMPELTGQSDNQSGTNR